MDKYMFAMHMLASVMNFGGKLYRLFADISGLSTRVFELYTVSYRDASHWAYGHTRSPIEVRVCRTCAWPMISLRSRNDEGTVRISRVLMDGTVRRVLWTSEEMCASSFYTLDALMVTMRNGASLNKLLRGVLFADEAVSARQLTSLAHPIPKDDEREVTLIDNDFEESTFKDMAVIPLNAAFVRRVR